MSGVKPFFVVIFNKALAWISKADESDLFSILITIGIGVIIIIVTIIVIRSLRNINEKNKKYIA